MIATVPKPAELPIPPDLLEQVAAGKCVLFLGNDLPDTVGAWQGPPNRAGLARELSQRCALKTPAADLCEAVDAFLADEVHTEQELRRIVSQAVGDPRLYPGPLHQMVAGLGFDAVVSQSFDDLLESALRAAGRRVLQVIADEEIAYDGPQQETVVIRLAGSASRPDTLVLSQDNQLDVENGLSERMQAVRGWCILRPLLFVGWDPGDENLRRLFRAVAMTPDIHRRPSYMVWPGDCSQATVLRRYNVRILPAEPQVFLAELAARVAGLRRPASEAEQALRKAPYKFLDYFGAADQDIFFGREVEIPLLHRLVLSHRLLTVFGQSGVGKTSLLLAGVLPRLQADGCCCAYLRPMGDLLRTLRNAVVEALYPGLPELDKRRRAEMGDGLADFLVKNLEPALPRPVRLVVIIDQFEELYTHPRSAATRRAFWQELGKCLKLEQMEVHFVLSLREDYLANLDEARRAAGDGQPAPLPSVLRHSYRLNSLDVDRAYLAIVEPAKRANCEVEPRLVDVLLERAPMPAEAAGTEAAGAQAEPGSASAAEAAGEWVESVLPAGVAERCWSLREAGGQVPPPALQIVMDALYRDALRLAGWSPPRRGQTDWQPPGQKLSLSLARYRRLGGAGNILAEYVHRALDEAPADGFDRRLAVALLKIMVTSQKTKAALTEADLANELAASAPWFNFQADLPALRGTLSTLLGLRLLRGFDLNRQACYELAHDHLAAEIASWVSQSELELRLARELLRSQVSQCRQHRLLISLEVLCMIRKQADAMILQPEEQELLLCSALETFSEVAYWRGRAQPEVVAKVENELLETLAGGDAQPAAAAADRLAALASPGLVARLAQWVEADFDDRPVTSYDLRGRPQPVRRSLLNLRTPRQRYALQTLAQMCLPEATRALEQWTPPGMCLVPAGSFVMGEGDARHELWLDAFWVDCFPVTNAQYAAFLQSGAAGRRELWTAKGWERHQGQAAPQDWEKNAAKMDHPVVGVTWYQALACARWMGKRLLTEAEWEKAASWGPAATSGEDSYRYPWGNTFEAARCNSGDPPPGQDTPVGTTTPVDRCSPQGDSRYGCADMAGNAWEWCSSLYAPYPYNPGDGRENLETTDNRILRGGAYMAHEKDGALRCTYRNPRDPFIRPGVAGLRCGWGGWS